MRPGRLVPRRVGVTERYVELDRIGRRPGRARRRRGGGIRVRRGGSAGCQSRGCNAQRGDHEPAPNAARRGGIACDDRNAPRSRLRRHAIRSAPEGALQARHFIGGGRRGPRGQRGARRCPQTLPKTLPVGPERSRPHPRTRHGDFRHRDERIWQVHTVEDRRRPLAPHMWNGETGVYSKFPSGAPA